MRYNTIILLFICSSSLFGQDALNPCNTDGICPYHEILLKNNYQLNIGDTVQNRRTIRLKGLGVDTIIRSVTVKTPNSYLGWLAADFDECFVLYSTYSGNYVSRQPISVYVFEKKTGKLLVTGPLIEFNKLENTILFIEFKQQEKLGLLDLTNMSIKYFDPLDTACESWWWCIKYNQVTEKQLTIDYMDWNNQLKRKIYVR